MINYFLIFISFFHYLILLFFYEKKIPIHVIESKLGLFCGRNVVFSDTTTIKKNRSRNSNVKNNNITKTINIMFMLPLLMDSTNKNHELLSERALSFYLGSKYASDFFLSKKQKINIQVFDTKNEKNRIIKFLETYNFSNTHVIIGPFFRSSLEEVSKKNKKIPIISPFVSSDSLNDYPNIIQSEVKDIDLVDPILEEIKFLSKKEKIKTLYLLGTTNRSKKIADYIKYKLLQWDPHFQTIFFYHTFPISANVKKYPFFSVLLGGDAYIGKQFFDFIKHFSTKQIKPFGIGDNDIYYQNIPILKKYRFVFTTKHHFNKKKRKIFSLIRKKFGKDLNKYKLLGFDLTYDLLCRLTTTTTDRNLFKTIEKEEFTGIVSKYHYKKISKKGGYKNKGLWIIRLLFCNYFLK